MSTRGARFGFGSDNGGDDQPSAVRVGEVVAIDSGSSAGKWLVGLALAAVGGYAAHDAIKHSHTRRALHKDARHARTVARRGYKRLVGKVM